MRRFLSFDRRRCLGCRNCELACSVAHSQSQQLETAITEDPRARRRVAMEVRGGIEALRCEQCSEPLCVFSCKSGALARDPFTGLVSLDESRCVACYMCLMVCPSGIRPDPSGDPPVRCDVCLGRDMPACVAACPTGALGMVALSGHRSQSEFEGHVVIVGSSAAGIAACEAAREFAPQCSITLVTADASPRYSRPLLSYFLAGRIGPSEINWRVEGYLEHELRVKVIPAVQAAGVKFAPGRLMLTNGAELGFDRLIVATGARGVSLSIPGASLTGVCSLRNLDDLKRIDGLAQPGTRAVVLGGGNIGLQVSEALLARGLNVTVVVSSLHLLSQMVDAEAGSRVAELFLRHGLNVRTRRDAVEIVGNGRVEGVRLNDGERIGADLVVVGKGIIPNVEWLRASGIEIRKGIAVDLMGRTNVPEVFAAGDCAESIDPLTGSTATSGVWPVAYEMGRTAGSTAVGVERPFGGALRMNASRFFGVSIVSIGEPCQERLEGASAQVLESREGVYRKLVFHRARLAGALLYGDISGAGIFYRLYRERVELGDGVAAELKEKGERLVLGPLIPAAAPEVLGVS